MTILALTRGLAAAFAIALSAALAPVADAQKAPPPDPAKLAAAKDLMAAQGGIEQARKGLDQSRTAMIAEVRKASPEEADGFARFMETYVGNNNPKVTKFFEDVIEATTIFYAERCTVEEMKAMTAFLKTAEGRRFIELAPEVSSIIAPRFLEFQRGLIADVQAASQRGDFKKK